MAKYLIDERPMSVQPTLAAIFGLTEAVILQEIHWWICQPRSGKLIERVQIEDGRAFEGCVWVWNTAQQWSDFFKWLKPDTVRKHLATLESQMVLVSYQEKGTDRTKYYTIDYAALNSTIEGWETGKESRLHSEKNAGCNRHGVETLHSEKNAGSSIPQKGQAKKTGAARPPRPVVEAPAHLKNQKPPNSKPPAWMGPTEPDPRIAVWRALTSNAPLNKIQEGAILSEVDDCAKWEAIVRKSMLYHTRANAAKFIEYYKAGDVPVFGEKFDKPKGGVGPQVRPHFAPTRPGVQEHFKSEWEMIAEGAGWDV